MHNFSTMTFDDTSTASAPSMNAVTVVNDDGLPHTASLPDSLGDRRWSLESVIDHCASWRPDIAARQRNSSLCVSEIITQIRWRDRIYDLNLVSGRWAAIYIRVSTEAQRSGRSNRKAADGYSELHQLRACIEWCINNGYAFRVYSDAGITSAYPPDDPNLIRVLLKAKADRYAKIYDRVWLSDAARIRHTAAEISSMESYRDKAVAKIKAGPFRDSSDVLPALARRNSRVFHRQAMTQLWRDMESRQVHRVVVTDKSRLLRSADLEKLFFEMAHETNVKVVGTEESVLDFDVSEPEQKGMLYLLASMNEKKLIEAGSNAMKGFAELLRGGKPHSSLSFWLTRDSDGNAITIPENVPLVRRIIDLYLEGAGGAGIISACIREEGMRLADGRDITGMMVTGVLEGTEIAGIQKHFGLDWPILPPVVSPETVADLHAFRQRQEKVASEIAAVGGPQVRAHHLFRSLAFCECGRPCQHHDDYNIYEPVGYLLCHRRKRRASAEYPGGHAYFPESVLGAWMGEIMPHVDHLLRSTGSAEDRVRQRRQSIEDVKTQIEEAEQALEVRRQEALENARRSAPVLGIPVSAPNYEQVVSGIAEAMTASDVAAINDLRSRLTLLEQEATADRASSRVRANLADVTRWPNLDTAAQNQILRAVFDRIVLSPSPILPKKRADLLAAGQDNATMLEQGSLTLYLHGVPEPLPPVKMYRGGRSGRAVRLESPQEWLMSMFGIASQEDLAGGGSKTEKPGGCSVNSSHLVSFLAYMRRYEPVGDNDPMAALADAIRNDRRQPLTRLTVKTAARDYLQVRGFSVALLSTLDAAWDMYIEREKARIVPVLARKYSESEAREAWERYLDAQIRKQEKVAAMECSVSSDQ